MERQDFLIIALCGTLVFILSGFSHAEIHELDKRSVEEISSALGDHDFNLAERVLHREKRRGLPEERELIRAKRPEVMNSEPELIRSKRVRREESALEGQPQEKVLIREKRVKVQDEKELIRQKREPADEEPTLIRQKREPADEEPTLIRQKRGPADEEPTLIRQKREPADEEPTLIRQKREPADEEPTLIRQKRGPADEEPSLIRQKRLDVNIDTEKEKLTRKRRDSDTSLEDSPQTREESEGSKSEEAKSAKSEHLQQQKSLESLTNTANIDTKDNSRSISASPNHLKVSGPNEKVRDHKYDTEATNDVPNHPRNIHDYAQDKRRLLKTIVNWEKHAAPGDVFLMKKVSPNQVEAKVQSKKRFQPFPNRDNKHGIRNEFRSGVHSQGQPYKRMRAPNHVGHYHGEGKVWKRMHDQRMRRLNSKKRSSPKHPSSKSLSQ